MSGTVVDAVSVVDAADVGLVDVGTAAAVDVVTADAFVVVVDVMAVGHVVVGVVVSAAAAAVVVDALQPSPGDAVSAEAPQGVRSDWLGQVPFSSGRSGRAVGPAATPSGGDCAVEQGQAG